MLAVGACAIILLTVFAYIPAMRGGFVWDDDMYLTRNPLITAPDGLSRIWFSLDSPSQYFPLVYTVFRTEHSLWGFNPLGYHVVNVFLHIANALLLWLILRRLSIPGAWLAAAIFALHPVNVESVAWITELKNVLSTIFYLLSVLAWIQFLDQSGNRRRLYYALGLASCALALFAKTTACTIPAVLLIVLWIRRERIDARRIVQVMPFVIMGMAMALLSIWWERNHAGTIGPAFAFSPAERILIAGRALWFYLGKLIWPAKLAFSYPKWQVDARDPAQYLWPAAYVIAAAALWIGRKRWSRGPLIAAVYFTAVLGPMLGFISLYTFRYSFVADHYQYLACVGPIVLFALLVGKVKKPPVLRYAVPALVLCILGVLAWRQGSAYRDAETLWRDTIAKNPASSMAHNELAVILLGRGETGEAEVHLRDALHSDPDNCEAHSNMAVILIEDRQFSRAARECREALRLNPGYAGAHTNLGNALTGMGQFHAAEKEYAAAVKLTPDNGSAHYNLALCLARLGRLHKAKEQFEETLRINPDDADAQRDLATTLRLLGRR